LYTILDRHMVNCRQSKKILRNVTISEPKIEVYGISIRELETLDAYEHKALVFLGSRKASSKTRYEYSIRRKDIDIWIRVRRWNVDQYDREQRYCFWTLNGAYLDAVEYALWNFLEEESVTDKGILEIRADTSMQFRIMNPLKKHPIQSTINKIAHTIHFLRYEKDEFLVSRSDRKSIPRIVPKHCCLYWKLLSTYTKDTLSDSASNLAFKFLLRTEFKAIKWERLRRGDLIGLRILSGGWRNRETLSLKCSTCAQPIDTTSILNGSCGHFKPKLVK